MSMTQDLFLSILAMDSYNRGYNAGVNGLGEIGSQLGDATISTVSTGPNAFATGFYAVSYSWNGKTVISYRGTDSPGSSAGAGGGDIVNGWILSLALPASQVTQAAAFYQQVTGQNIYAGPAANVILTGHSLGGGLAEIMSLISGTQGVGFDYAPGAILAEIKGAIGKSILSPMNWGSFKGISTTGEVLQFGRNGAIQLGAAVLALLPILLGYFSPAAILGAADSVYAGDGTGSVAAAAQANLKGFGNVADLSVAASHDTTLLAQFAAFKASVSIECRQRLRHLQLQFLATCVDGQFAMG